ncbi:hypothetical protein [Spongiimicrobium salis]|uniref:hypothetical protein n=1 Tax=Spongiimicrobium salis TaxID=1667022 RepID=UPI00374DEF23
MKSILKSTLIILCFLCISFSYAQDTTDGSASNGTNLAFSVQVYPAGIIPTVNLEQFVNENSSWVYRLGGNFTDRRDFSDENDNEEGAGFGGSVGFRKHYAVGKGKIIAGFNVDLWNLWIDWEDASATPNEGTTYIFVVQPWLETGYFFNVGKNKSSQLGITLGFGREINAITSGDDVAQDWIGSIGVQYQFAIK